MISEQGIVEKVRRHKALVRIEKSAACAGCSSQGACHGLSDKEMMIEVANELEAKEGDRVEISVPAHSLLKLSFLVYFLPILALVVGAYLGDKAFGSLGFSPSLGSMAGGGLAMGITYYALRKIDRSIGSNDSAGPRMTRILPNAVPLQSCDSK